jgi:hypothetical protein
MTRTPRKKIALPALDCHRRCQDLLSFTRSLTMEEFGIRKKEWLKTFLELKNGIPTHDTVARVFARLSPSAFQERFVGWVQAIASLTEDEVIAIDGKIARRSYHKGSGIPAMHLVSAWATRNRMALGQIKVDEKSNEITAVCQ